MNTKDWEKEFDEKFSGLNGNSFGEIRGITKDFISSLLSRRDAEVREMVEKKFSSREMPQELAEFEMAAGELWKIAQKKHNKDLDDILSALQDQTK